MPHVPQTNSSPNTECACTRLGLTARASRSTCSAMCCVLCLESLLRTICAERLRSDLWACTRASPLAPKELRSSLVTWLRSDANSDAVLKSAAFAMRHSPAQAAGVAYDRERAERLSRAAVEAVRAHAARF